MFIKKITKHNGGQFHIDTNLGLEQRNKLKGRYVSLKKIKAASMVVQKKEADHFDLILKLNTSFVWHKCSLKKEKNKTTNNIHQHCLNQTHNW